MTIIRPNVIILKRFNEEESGSNGYIAGWATSVLGVIVVLPTVELLIRTNSLPGRYFPPVTATFLVLVEQLQNSNLR